MTKPLGQNIKTKTEKKELIWTSQEKETIRVNMVVRFL